MENSIMIKPETPIQLPTNPTFTDRRIVTLYNNYGGLLHDLAKDYEVALDAIVGTFIVESGGAGYGPTGKVLIRFENHIFYNMWGFKNTATFWKHFSFDAGKRWVGHTFRGQPFHGNQMLEHTVLEFAYTLNPYAAMCSISMGGPQIMGFNHKAAGYATPQLMYKDFQAGMDRQILGFFRFIAASSNRLAALRKPDWLLFASLYNGSGQAKTYAGLIQSTANRFNALINAPVQAV